MPTRSHHRAAYSYVHPKTGKTVHVKAHTVTYHMKSVRAENKSLKPRREYTRRAAGRPIKGPEFYEKYPKYVKGHKHKVFPANYSLFN
jgi:hypothetical protein